MRRKYRRVGFTAAQSADLWERWKKDEGLKSIGRVGVHWVKRDCKWRAQIAVDQRCIVLGDFENFGEACATREAGQLKYFGIAA